MDGSRRQRKDGMWNPNFPFRPESTRVFYGWIICILSTVGVCASMPGQTIGVSVFTSRLTSALSLSMMQLSVAYMLGTLLCATCLNRGGRYFDQVGARKSLVFSLIALGFVLIGLSFVEVFSVGLGRLPLFDQNPWFAPFVVITLGFAMLRFTGQGMVTLASRSMLGIWFDKRRGFVTACSGSIVALTFSVAPLGFEYLIRLCGWQWAWRSMGLFILFSLVALFWALCRDNPEECGLEMDGGKLGKVGRENLDAVIYRDLTKDEARRTFSFWAFTLVFALQGLVVTAYAFHVLEVAVELEVSNEYILGLFVPSGIVAVLVGFGVGWLTDFSFIRIKYLLFLMAASGGLCYLTLAVGHYPEAAWVHIIGFGISGGCFGSLSTVVFPRFFGRSHIGAINGLFMTTLVVASAVGPVLFSISERFLGAYRNGFFIAAAIAGLLACTSCWAENPQRRFKQA